MAEFARLLETENISEYGIDLIEASGSLTYLKTQSRTEVRPSTRVAITHFTYASRKGISKYHYAFLKFIDAQTQLFIDECDSFVDAQRVSIPLGWRGRLFNVGGEPTYVHTAKCLVTSGNGNCTQCKMRKWDGNQFIRDIVYHIRVYGPRFRIESGDVPERLPFIDLEPYVEQRFAMTTTIEATVLREQAHPRAILFAEGTAIDPKDLVGCIIDLIETAYRPTAWRHFIHAQTGELTTDEVIARYVDAQGKLNVPPEDQVRFPVGACNVITLTLTDKLALRHLAHARSITGLTATISQNQRRFLVDHLPALKHLNVPPEDRQKIDRVAVIGLRRKIDPKRLPKLAAYRVLRFKPNKREAAKEYQAIRATCPAVLGRDLFDYQKLEVWGSQAVRTSDPLVMITHSGGTLGRGVNLPDYRLVLIDSSVYKPTIAYNTQTADALWAAQEEDRANTLLQNIGRVLRKPPDEPTGTVFKLIVVEHLDHKDELKAIAHALQPMCKAPVQARWIEPFVAPTQVLTLIEETLQTAELCTKFTFQHYVDHFYQTGVKAGRLKQLKQGIAWSWMARYLSPQQKDALRTAYEQGLAAGGNDQQTERQRARRLKKLNALLQDGQTPGRIRSAMNVRKWPEQEQDWFAEQVAQLVHSSEHTDIDPHGAD